MGKDKQKRRRLHLQALFLRAKIVLTVTGTNFVKGKKSKKRKKVLTKGKKGSILANVPRLERERPNTGACTL